MKKLEFHPASGVFRLLDGSEFKELCDSIEKHGQQVPIRVLDGLVLDGRNRYNACLKVGAEPWIEKLTKADLEGMSPLDYVVAMNQHRRHDDAGQRALAAARIKEQYAVEAKERQRMGKANLPYPETAGQSRDKAGEAMGVAGRTVDAAEKVIKHAAPEVVAAVEAGKVSVSDAASVSTAPKSKQKAALSDLEAGKARTLKTALESYAPKPEAKDKDGKPIPKNLQSLFARASEFESLCKACDEIAAGVRKLSADSIGVHLHEQSIVADLNNVKNAIRFAKPYAVCPYCSGGGKYKGDKCGSCRGIGFVGRSKLKSAPAEMRA